MKSCLPIFKSVSVLEKTVDTCKIKLNMEDARLIFQLYCKHGIVKTYNLTFIETESLQAVFSKDLCPNRITAPTRLLCETVLNFQTTQDEVTLVVNPERVRFKNYVEDEADASKVMHTYVDLDPEEFDSLQVGVDTDVTFSLKDLRAILSFTEATDQPLSLCFDTPGKHMILSVDSDPSFEANVVLATMVDRDALASCSQHSAGASQARALATSRNIHDASCASERSSSKRRRNGASGGHQARRATSGGGDSMRVPVGTGVGGDTTRASVRPTTGEQENRESGRQHAISKPASTRTSRMKSSERLDEIMRDNLEDLDGSDVMVPERDAISRRTLLSGHSDGGESPVIPALYPTRRSPDQRAVTDTSGLAPAHPPAGGAPGGASSPGSPDARDDEEDEVLPGTPPAKKFKSLFFGLSQGSVRSLHSASQNSVQVLAEDTDEED